MGGLSAFKLFGSAETLATVLVAFVVYRLGRYWHFPAKMFGGIWCYMPPADEDVAKLLLRPEHKRQKKKTDHLHAETRIKFGKGIVAKQLGWREVPQLLLFEEVASMLLLAVIAAGAYLPFEVTFCLWPSGPHDNSPLYVCAVAAFYWCGSKSNGVVGRYVGGGGGSVAAGVGDGGTGCAKV